jgi:hypothetical protein
MRNCQKCKHRAELHPEYENADFASLPCARCIGDIDDTPKRLALVDEEFFTAQTSESVNERPVPEGEKLRMMGDLLDRITDIVDLRIIQTVRRKPGASFRAIAKAVGVDDKTVAARIRILRIATN